MIPPELPAPTEQQNTCYRNIYTIKTSRPLFDDLVELNEIPILQAWDNQTSDINHGIPPKNRVFQYGNVLETGVVFDPLFWRRGRFGDGQSYGVWYGALSEDTSIKEALYWAYRFTKPSLKFAEKAIIVDRKMFEVDVKTKRGTDLRPLEKKYPDLVHETDYRFCQELGEWAVSNKIELYLTPSVRAPGGTCIPVFSADALVVERAKYFLHFEFGLDGCIRICKDDEKEFVAPPSWDSATQILRN